MKNDNKRLRELSDNYEVEFDPAAWDKMEKLLPEPASPKPPFLLYLISIAAVLLILLALYFGLSDTGNPQTPIAETQTPQVEEIAAAADEKPTQETTAEKKTQTKKTTKSTDFTVTKNTEKTLFAETEKYSFTLAPSAPATEKTYLHTDRTLYRPGESIWFTVYLRNAGDLRPSTQSELVYVEWIAPNGNTEKKLTLITENGAAAGDILLNPQTVGGTYTLKAYTNYQRNTETFFEKKIQVQKTVLPRLRMELDFAREAYGAGDAVTAKFDVNSLENTPLAGKEIRAVIRLGGEQFEEITGKTDALGHAEITFALPNDLNTNDGILNVLLDHNGQTESIARPVPIVLGNIDLQFFPEGGEAVAGTQNRMAFKAVNEFGEPADIEGVVKNATGEIVRAFKSYHAGHGAFALTPTADDFYTAEITKPVGINTVYNLPQAKRNSQSLSIKKQEKDRLLVDILTAEKETLVLVAQARDEVFYSRKIKAQEGRTAVEIPTKNLPVGIVQLTLFDTKDNALAERLVFVNQDKKLNIAVTTDKEKYLPREHVKMSVAVTDDAGKPVAGTFSLAVADDNQLTYVDDKQPHILAQMLLQSDVKGDIHEPNFYFETARPGEEIDRAQALDLLLMTQGWRRFKWVKEEAVAAGEYPAERAVVGGYVRDVKERPVVGETVYLANNRETKTDENGYFEFSIGNLNVQNSAQVKIGTRNYNVKIGSTTQAFYRYTPGPVSMYVADCTSAKGETGISGKVTDFETDEALLFADVVLYKNGVLLMGTQTDFDGNFLMKTEPGEYDMQVLYVGYEKIILEKITVENGKTTTVHNAELFSGINLEEVQVIDYQVPLVEQDNTTQGPGLTGKINPEPLKPEILQDNVAARSRIAFEPEPKRLQYYEQREKEKAAKKIKEEIAKRPTKDITGIISQPAGAGSAEEDDAVSIRGSRSDATYYYIDGVRVAGNLIEQQKNKPKINQNFAVDKFKTDPVYLRPRQTADPLFYIDDTQMTINAQEILTADQIEKVEVLNAEKATERYGTTGKNGAIIVTTKNGLSEVAKRKLLEAEINSFENFVEELSDRAARGEFVEPDNSSFFFDQLRVTKVQFAFGLYETKEVNRRSIAAFKRASRIISEYKQANNFKKGFYRARTFYTPKYESKKASALREDFRTTVFWEPLLQVGADGKASVEFYNSDAITTFRTTVEGMTDAGGIGRAEATFYTILPFAMTTKVPTNVMTGDRIELPVTLMNNTAEQLRGKLNIAVPTGFILGDLPTEITLNPKEKRTLKLPLQVNNDAENGEISLRFATSELTDAFTQDVSVLQRGFPVNEVLSGRGTRNKFTLKIDKPVAGSVTTNLRIYPDATDDLISSAEKMLRQPTGCFEQTSSSNYPNLLVLDLLRSTDRNRPQIEQKALQYLRSGYERLKSYEVSGGGFDWYGRPPAHEALTAYGLMQFVDMQAVFPVDKDLINRTAEWLLGRRDGTGGWTNSKRALHSWAAQTPVGDAYIVWALTEAGYGAEIPQEIEKSYRDALATQDPYITALTVLTLQNISDKRANNLLQKLSQMQNEADVWQGKTHSMTHSKGKALTVETTALTLMAMLRTEGYRSQIEDGIQYIYAAKNHYGYGNTQSTVLALKAIVAYTKKHPADKTEGAAELVIDGKTVERLNLFNGSMRAITFADFADRLTPGVHTVEVNFDDKKSSLPFALSVGYKTLQPSSAPDCALHLTTDLQTESAAVGETVRYTAELQNVTDADVANPMAVVGIPAGLTLQPQQLQRLTEREIIDYYELKDNYLVLYFRGLAAQEKRKIDLDLKADIAGKFEAPASVAYLYYENEKRHWVQPTETEVR